MKMATRAIPLVADTEPVEVLYEDDDIIAVNKPAGVTSGPKHRYKVSRAGCLHRAKFTIAMLRVCSDVFRWFVHSDLCMHAHGKNDCDFVFCWSC